MDSIEAKLKEMGLELPPPRKPTVANLVKTVRSGNLLFVSGHGPWTADGPKYKGKIGRDLTVEQGYEAARLCALGCLISIKVALGSLDQVKQVVKVLGFVNSTEDLYEQPRVMNGASDLFVALYGDRGRHSRSAIGVAALPLNMAVEIEMTVEI